MENLLTVSDLLPDVKRVLGVTDDGIAYARLNDAVEILAVESEWDPLRASIDVCMNCCERQVTLPKEVDTILAVNIDGRPSQAHDVWFRFHLNGPGEKHWWRDYGWHWFDKLQVPTYCDLSPQGSSLVIQLESPADSGTPVRVYGYDAYGNWIRSLEGGVYVDGFLVPTVYGNPIINPAAPQIVNIARVSKLSTQGYVSLYVLNPDTTVYRIGWYSPSETEPSYRRIQVSKPGSWCRILFRKRVLILSQPTDIIPLHSKYSIVTMVKALKKLDDDRAQESSIYHQLAVDFLKKKQLSVDVPSGPSIQIADENLIANKHDRME